MVERDINSPEVERRNIWVAIMGVPASGKSTLAQVIADKLGFVHVPELDVEKEDLFKSYCADPQKYSFPMQILFLFDKWQHTQGSRATNVEGIRGLRQHTPVVSQPTIWQDGLFARARLKKTSEYAYYKELYDGLVSSEGFPEPDLTVYMRIRFDSMLARIVNRAKEIPAREPELQEDPAYWKKLWKFHEVWLRSNYRKKRIAVIDADLFDYSRFGVKDVAKDALLKEFLHQARYHLVGPIGEAPNPPDGLTIPQVILDHRPDNLSPDITPGLATGQKLLQRL